MAFYYRRALEWMGAFVIWLSQPYIIAILGICIGFGLLTWQFMDEPIFGFTIRAFITKTLPVWVNSFITYAAQAAMRRPIWKIVLKVASVIALQAMVEHLRRHFEDELARWEHLSLLKKTLVFICFVAVLWLLIGWWAFALFPIFAARDLLVAGVRWVIHAWGLSPLLERIEQRLYIAVPEPLRVMYDRFDRAIHAWAQHHRKRLHNHHRVRALKESARRRLLEKKRRKEAEKRRQYTEAFRERFRNPPFL